jgi:hypothetical protein
MPKYNFMKDINYHESYLHLIAVAKNSLKSVERNVIMYVFTWETQIIKKFLLNTVKSTGGP